MAIVFIVLLVTLTAFSVNPLPLKQFQYICPPNGEIVAPHPTSCSKYISCTDGSGVERKCQNGTVFNYEEGICTDRNETVCDLCQFNTKPVQLLPFEGNCSKYIICYGMSRVERECPVGLYFNMTLGMCDQQENVDCTEDSDDDNLEPIETPIQCRNNNQVEFVPSLESCGNYFICTNGVPSAHQCEDEHIFNIALSRCSTTGRCLHDYVPICVSSGTFLPHLFECRHYFHCEPNKNEPTLRACRLGELFDRSISRCAAENTVSCPNPPEEDLDNWPNTAA